MKVLRHDPIYIYTEQAFLGLTSTRFSLFSRDTDENQKQRFGVGEIYFGRW